VDAQSLILESDVICAINSTVMLEAGIAGKPIIVPFFKECQKSDDRLNNIKLKEYFHLFEVAIDDAELKSKILKHLRSPIKISEEVMEGRKKVFEDFVSSMDADATERYVSLLRSMTDVKVY
jgi:CDP-glycerol glycerophosphotransferase (TagB/SpsB family)